MGTLNFKPFESIGLCFSGGGYRATFFALGVISYLNKVKYKDSNLLKKTEAMSTVSGGTLLGVAYAKAAQDPDLDFGDFFREVYNTFKPENDKLLETAIKKLEDDAVWKDNPHKKRSLINAFALTYAEMDLYSGAFELFRESPTEHVKHLCFNATDFSFGLAFRFQNTGRFGNYPLNTKEVDALMYDVQLGDIVASSSCFPLGFEPLVFPDDYFKDQNTTKYKALKSLERFTDGVGIMDGGIADNQGIGSMINISEQKNRDRELDLIVVNDVGSYKMVPWQQDTTKIDKSTSLKTSINTWLGYFGVKPLYWITLLVGVLLIVLNSLELFKGQAWTSLYIIGSVLTGVGLTLTVAGILLAIGKAIGIASVKRLFKENVPEPLLDDVLSFEKLGIDLIKRMLIDRMTSSAKMINDIFLKQIRRLNYRILYSEENLKNKIITSTVYALNGKKTPYSNGLDYNKEIKPPPGKLLQSVGLTASETPTTLWWDETDIRKNRMETLIACGQFTSCYELMDYIIELKRDLELDEGELKLLDDMYEELNKDWKAFNENPFYMTEAYLKVKSEPQSENA
ncbi:patatin-like phospholipase family protein [Aureitalea sp. L0-47]|uniref:patatin-like phospholipase family protein n=1 Tax=Aureitalea sp. L0-47 TaxID=2816962 RepID=UPI002236F3EC|nr:patatin-like phospholipase family protein [Aureitalea sp. L0-47]MCW5519425.1 patatin-like phospholipase family protein [Aureitalea sp. L0-47]